jgi:hypothetical protein
MFSVFRDILGDGLLVDWQYRHILLKTMGYSLNNPSVRLLLMQESSMLFSGLRPLPEAGSLRLPEKLSQRATLRQLTPMAHEPRRLVA